MTAVCHSAVGPKGSVLYVGSKGEAEGGKCRGGQKDKQQGTGQRWTLENLLNHAMTCSQEWTKNLGMAGKATAPRDSRVM